MVITSSSVTVALLLLLCFQFTQGKLVFRNPLHDARIYEGAPPGVHVTTVHAYEPQSIRKSVMYSLLDVRDHAHFTIDSTSGNITTSKTVEKKNGDTYEIIAVAISQGETKLRQLQVTVTEYNEHPPILEHDVYRGELHVKTKLGASVLRVRATDADTVPYNAEVYYKLDPEDPKGRLAMDPMTGTLTLVRTLDTSPLQSIIELGVAAEDGGSPKRTDTGRIEILIKTISEPRDVRYTNATGSKVHVCWTKPKHGHVTGYLVKYREVENPHGTPSFHNITSNATSQCTTLVELKPWTDYEFRVYGWNVYETGQGSTVGRFGTRPDYCQMNICQHGECHVLNEEPGYHCDCISGYYGDVCDKFDPCSLNPCENFGLCRNVSHNKYRCECLSGFSGQNCSEFNPCALRPSPCQNGGRCESTASHKYQCYCTKGYFGKTCQFFDPCSAAPCQNGGRCQNVTQVDYVCKCVAGYEGKQCELDIDECSSSPCKHGGMCLDAVNTFHCRCLPGYRGKRCHLVEHCVAQTVQTNKGLFRWNSTAHGRAYLIECPFGSIFPDREGAVGYAKRRCYLLSNGSVAWGRMDLGNCREEGFKNAEDLTDDLRHLTNDPKHLNVARLQEAAKQIESVIEYAIYDKKIAYNMLSIISNMLDIDDHLLETGDRNGTTTFRLTDLVDRFVAEVRLEKGESLELETENLVVKAASWDPDSSDFNDVGVSFPVRYRQQRQRREQQTKAKQPLSSYHVLTVDRQPHHHQGPIIDDDSELTVPLEALLLAQNQSDQELRVKFVAYRNDKFFRSKTTFVSTNRCWWNKERRECVSRHDPFRFAGRQVIQASIVNASVSNLSDPVIYILPSPPHMRVYCAYWKENERSWSTEGLTTNQSSNATTCYSNHMTAFSLLLDPTPNEGISADHQLALSMISYIGCGLSMLGLSLTILTYSLFRCLNRDHPGQILLHLCSSMLLMNAAFVAGSQKGHDLYGVDVCVSVAVLVHYFLLTTLSWMGVEAANMYQLLVHVFASAESRFMMKRAILAWGVPLLIVGVTVLIDWGVYQNQNEYCMLSAANPFVYYISYLGPSCLILLVNLTVFVMVTRVLITPRNVSKPVAAAQKPEKVMVTAAQVRGAFTVMILLGVSWVFGAFAVGSARLVFQYLFCIANSLQGFLIFVVRCLQYPEARSAWCQLLKTGTFKKYRGIVPPGSWSGNSNSSHNKQNGNSTTTTRMGSLDANAVPFNSNFWNKPTEKEGQIPYDDPQIDNGHEDFVTRSAHLLTFSPSFKVDPTEEPHITRLSGDLRITKPISETSETDLQQRAADVTSPDVPNLDNTTLPRDSVLSAEVDVLALSEAKSRCSFASSTGYSDDESKVRTLDKKPLASKAPSTMVHPKQTSTPSKDADKQNSWPRTLSSFLGGKDVIKSSQSEICHQSTLPRRLFSTPAKSPLSECIDRHSCQVIPLQMRPSTPLTHPSTFTPTRNLSLESENCLLEEPSGPPEDYSRHQNLSCDQLPSERSYVHHPLDDSQRALLNCPMLDDGRSEVTVSGPGTRVFVLTPDRDTDRTKEMKVDENTYRIWERQGLVSPNKTMYIDSAASRL